MISAFDLSGPQGAYGSFWTTLASGAKTVGTKAGTAVQGGAETWKSLDPETQAFLFESGQTALAQALAARQQRLAAGDLSAQDAQMMALQAQAQRPPSGVPPWLLPVAVVGVFGLVAAMIMRKPAAGSA